MPAMLAEPLTWRRRATKFQRRCFTAAPPWPCPRPIALASVRWATTLWEAAASAHTRSQLFSAGLPHGRPFVFLGGKRDERHEIPGDRVFEPDRQRPPADRGHRGRSARREGRAHAVRCGRGGLRGGGRRRRAQRGGAAAPSRLQGGG